MIRTWNVYETTTRPRSNQIILNSPYITRFYVLSKLSWPSNQRILRNYVILQAYLLWNQKFARKKQSPITKILLIPPQSWEPVRPLNTRPCLLPKKEAGSSRVCRQFSRVWAASYTKRSFKDGSFLPDCWGRFPIWHTIYHCFIQMGWFDHQLAGF